VAVLISLSAATRSQLGYWRDSVTLFSRTIAVTGENWMASNSLAIGYEQAGDTLRAMDEYREAIRINPDFTYARYNLGRLLLLRNDYKAAEEQFADVLSLRSDLDGSQFYLGHALEGQQRYEEAIAQYSLIPGGDPYYDEGVQRRAAVHYRQGNISAERGELDEAVDHYHKALSLKPEYPEALNNLGNILEYTGKYQESADLYEQALILRPRSAILHRSLAGVLEKLSQKEAAAEHLRMAENLETGDAR